MREADVLLWLSLTKGVGAVTARKLVEYAGNWAAVWRLAETEMVRAGLRAAVARELCRSREQHDPDAVRGRLAAEGVWYVSQADAEYPEALKSIYDPPAGLFVWGELPPCGEAAVAVVGARTPTPYGRQAAQRLAEGLAASGLTIVSGLARGIDTIAHEAVVQAGGRTVAVLGSGILQVYPKENLMLAKRIAEGGGAIVSEYHPLAPAKPAHFPVRNRIISGLCQGTLLIEAGERSGSLITADLALEQGREVYAVPGPIFSPQSAGTNRLIQQGARLVAGLQDIWEDYSILRRPVPVNASRPDVGSPEGELLLEALGFEDVHIDVLLQRTGWSHGQLHTWLMRLQLQGHVQALPGGRYLRNQ